MWAEYGRNYGVQSVENAGCWWVFEAEAVAEKIKTKRAASKGILILVPQNQQVEFLESVGRVHDLLTNQPLVEHLRVLDL